MKNDKWKISKDSKTTYIIGTSGKNDLKCVVLGGNEEEINAQIIVECVNGWDEARKVNVILENNVKGLSDKVIELTEQVEKLEKEKVALNKVITLMGLGNKFINKVKKIAE